MTLVCLTDIFLGGDIIFPPPDRGWSVRRPSGRRVDAKFDIAVDDWRLVAACKSSPSRLGIDADLPAEGLFGEFVGALDPILGLRFRVGNCFSSNWGSNFPLRPKSAMS